MLNDKAWVLIPIYGFQWLCDSYYLSVKFDWSHNLYSPYFFHLDRLLYSCRFLWVRSQKGQMVLKLMDVSIRIYKA